jgi:hypothetical protein
MYTEIRTSGFPRVEGHLRGSERIIDEELRRTEDDLGLTIARILKDTLAARTPRGKGPPKGNPAQRLYLTTFARVVGKGSNQYQVLRAIEYGQSKTVGRLPWNLLGLVRDGHQIVTRDGRVVGFVPGKDYPAEARRDADPLIEAAQRTAATGLGRAITRRVFH